MDWGIIICHCYSTGMCCMYFLNQLLNQIVCELPPEHPVANVRPLRDSLGHTPLQLQQKLVYSSSYLQETRNLLLFLLCRSNLSSSSVRVLIVNRKWIELISTINLSWLPKLSEKFYSDKIFGAVDDQVHKASTIFFIVQAKATLLKQDMLKIMTKENKLGR